MDNLDINELMIPMPAIDLIIKQVESRSNDAKKQKPFF
jgi:hypothetical protein